MRSARREGKLRIAMMLESDGPGGAEVVALRLAQELSDRGHYVVPVVPARGVGWLGERYREAGFTPREFYLNRTLDPGCVRRFIRLFAEERLDVVHSHEFTMAVYGAAATRLARIRHIITMHGAQLVAAVLRRRIALRFAFRNSDATVTISRDTRRSMCAELGVSERDIQVVLNGVPEPLGVAEPVVDELGLAPDEVVLLAVGNLDARKAHIVLLRAMQILRQRGLGTPWRIVIAAGRGGTEEQGLLAFASEHGFADRLHLLKSRTDVPNLLAAASIFVMPSLWEGLPMALLEAMFAGKAVVASSVSGIPEAITSGENGLLVAPGDAEGLAEALGRLMVDPSLRHKLGAAARRDAERRFSISVMADQYEQLYFGG